MKTIMQSTLITLCFSLYALNCFGVTARQLKYYSTRHSIGVEWYVSNDANHNAACSVAYRAAGQTSWKTAMDLYRVDFKDYDMLAGSIFSLSSGTTYEVQLTLTDPDGGAAEQTISIATSPLPSAPANGRFVYVVPGSGGGSGTKGDPFRGIAAAQAHLLPGDTVLLGGGSYVGESEFTASGLQGNYILYTPNSGEKAVLETIRVNGDHIWFQNLDIQGNEYGLRTYNDPEDIVLINNRFTGCHYCVYLNHGGTGWYIADNFIVGDVDPASGDFGGEGVELNHSDGHTVIYNSISRVADGVSYPGENCDIAGNEIFDVSDDGIEPDYGKANIRVYNNRISNAYHNGISFQPMNGAPWYILRNQVAAPVESALKFRDSVDRALIAHNTFVGWQGAQKSGSSFLTAVQSNNNLWISMTDWYAWENGSGGSGDWRTNLDYDGFDWGNYVYAFKWGERYASLESFSQATGFEQHGMRINKASCLSTIDIPNPPPASMALQYITLKPDCKAVDAGIALPNINDGYIGAGPDLGAYEVGVALPHYGPRTGTSPPPPGEGGRAIIAPLAPLLLDGP